MKHFTSYLLVALFTISFSFSASAFELRYNQLDAVRIEQQLDQAMHSQKKGKKLGWKKRLALKLAKKKLKKAAKKSADAPKTVKEGGNRSFVVTVLLSFFFGLLGIHRFYLGYPLIGIVQLFTLGGFGLWAFIDFILILFQVIKPKGGEYDD
ncbi:TM2 domain-containing protein [Saprospira grandis]|uniref:TM2 domain containing protein n=1 Tax=Saprospira grandis (strain Lewin) TaxID=984262 RepID=H6L8S6_SAPGL|nr:TM2 domain-containing protein [Saprospira grandis]AFC26882.1 TM2 domain containing protein [Saprospira grandis str. Lewin]